MGGSAFGKTFGKLTTKVVDPFGISKPLRRIIDPLNIMDPLNVLPTSGEKWLTADKNFGAPVMNWLNPKQSSYAPMTKGLSSNPQYFAQQQQMLANIKMQNQSEQLKQQAKLANLRSQAPLYPTSNSASITQSGQAPSSEKPSTTPATLAQSKIGDTTAPSDIPTEFIYKPATSTTKSVTANVFQMPDMSTIKFGGV